MDEFDFLNLESERESFLEVLIVKFLLWYYCTTAILDQENYEVESVRYESIFGILFVLQKFHKTCKIFHHLPNFSKPKKEAESTGYISLLTGKDTGKLFHDRGCITLIVEDVE